MELDSLFSPVWNLKTEVAAWICRRWNENWLSTSVATICGTPEVALFCLFSICSGSYEMSRWVSESEAGVCNGSLTMSPEHSAHIDNDWRICSVDQTLISLESTAYFCSWILILLIIPEICLGHSVCLSIYLTCKFIWLTSNLVGVLLGMLGSVVSTVKCFWCAVVKA